MNIFKAWTLWRKISPILKMVREADMSKNILKSRIFWVNILTAGVELSGALTGVIAPGTLQLVTNVLNIALRLVTKKAVTVLPENEPA